MEVGFSYVLSTDPELIESNFTRERFPVAIFEKFIYPLLKKRV